MPPTNVRLPAEWEPQDGVLLAWPHEGTHWRPYLDEARAATAEVIAAITRRERVILAAREPETVLPALARAGADLARVTAFAVHCNDTWARDFGPITVLEDGRPALRDFGYNAYGLKCPADQDNQITRRLAALKAFGNTPVRTRGLILEGGSIDSDGRGSILTTARCLASPNRNPHLDLAGIEAALHSELGAERILWLQHGCLAGDDTDGHVDTLARFAPDGALVYTHCSDRRDEHYEPLTAMENELRELRTPEGRPYRMVPLPWPCARFEADSQRLPLNYANFLVLNGAVLVPAYGDPADRSAQDAVGSAFPDRDIVPVDCSCLIRQRGAVHCLTMQIPKGVLG